MLLKIEKEKSKAVKVIGEPKIFVGIIEYSTIQPKSGEAIYKKVAIEPSYIRTSFDIKAFLLRCLLKINRSCNNILEGVCDECFEYSLDNILNIFKFMKMENVTFPICKKENNEVKFFIKITRIDDNDFIVEFLNKDLKCINTVIFSIKEIPITKENQEYFELTKEELILRLLF